MDKPVVSECQPRGVGGGGEVIGSSLGVSPPTIPHF